MRKPNQLLLEMGSQLRLSGNKYAHGASVYWGDPYLRILLERRLKIEFHIDRRFDSGHPTIRTNHASVSTRPIVEIHPHDYIWIVAQYDIDIASSLVMEDIERRIEESGNAAIAKLERMNKGEKPSIFSTRLYSRS